MNNSHRCGNVVNKNRDLNILMSVRRFGAILGYSLIILMKSSRIFPLTV